MVDILEVIYVIMGLLGAYFVLKKKKIGWILWLISTPFALALFYLLNRFGMILVLCVYAYIDYRGIIEWRKK